MLALLLIATYVPMVSGHGGTAKVDYPADPSLLVIDTFGEPESMDYAWCYDSASGEVLQAVYDTLVRYNVNPTLGPYEAASAGSGVFDMILATGWSEEIISETSPEGLTWYKRLTFTIRENVEWHLGGIMTPADVEYSFERQMVQDRAGGPTWMIFEPLLATYWADDYATDPLFGDKIDHSVESDATTVWFNFAMVFPTATFLQILAYVGTGGITSQAWAAANGDFDGNWAAGWEYIWDTWHDPAISPLNVIANGAGPFKFFEWVGGDTWTIQRHANYWQGWPAPISVGSTERAGGYLETITWNFVSDWTARKVDFLGGDADFTDVNRLYRDQVLGANGIRCFYPYGVLTVSGYFFNFEIDPTTAYAGGPTDNGYPSGTFAEDGIPRDVFSDVDMRTGIAYNFKYADWLQTVFLGEGWQPSDCVIEGLLYDNPLQEKYSYDAAQAEYYLKLAWGGTDGNSDGDMNDPEDTPGDLWTIGMSFTITFNIGNVARQQAAEMIANELNGMNPLFHVTALGVAWPIFLPTLVAGTGTIFVVGWGADYPDPHNFVYPFQHSTGTFSAWQSYNNPYVDAKIEEGIATADGPAREAIYYELQALHHDDVPSVMLVQGLGRFFEREWMRAWHYEAILSEHYYMMWKSQTHFGDVNNDGTVTITDMAGISAAWTGVGEYNTKSDINGGKGGTTGSLSGYFIGIPDGKVNIVDASLVSAYWDSPPGPSHP